MNVASKLTRSQSLIVNKIHTVLCLELLGEIVFQFDFKAM